MLLETTKYNNEAVMYIGYDKKNGALYAKICSGVRENGKVKTTQKSLGRVLDKEKGIYQNKERGVFTYNVETGEYGNPPASYVPPAVKRKNGKEKLILDFGDAYFLDKFIKSEGLYPVIEALGYGNADTTKAMVMCYILLQAANTHAETWLEGNFARELFPGANLTSQRISDFLAVIGDESNQRSFFSEYFKLVKHKDEGIIIDSTGLPNSIHFPLTAISNHNGEISNEVRLIYVLQQGTNLPLYFRYVPGNIVDISTLRTTMAELKAHNVKTKFAILDAGYLSNDNIIELDKAGISYLSRMDEKRKEYKKLVAQAKSELRKEENLIQYGGRHLYIISKEIEIAGCKAYAYVAQDVAAQSFNALNKSRRIVREGGSLSSLHSEIEDGGIFVLFSSRLIRKESVIDTYYTRQQIEQVFDLCKNNTNMLPLRTHTEETFRGHLVLSFVSSVIVKLLARTLNEKGINLDSALQTMRNQKCKVFDYEIIPQEPTKQQKAVYSIIKAASPVRIERKNSCY